MSEASTIQLRARVNAEHFRHAEEVFQRLGLKTSDAINVFLAQVALRKDMPFSITTSPERLLSDAEQARQWREALGEY